MNNVLPMLERWQLDVNQVRDRVYRAETPRERERWHALWLLAQGWTAAKVARALGREVREHLDAFFAGSAQPTDEVKQRCRRQLQALADALAATATPAAASPTGTFSCCD